MDGFARRKEQSKEEIRRAAWELFSQFGVDRVSMVDIARKAGVSQATIYNNFGSKEALVREFVTHAVEHLMQSVQGILSPRQQFHEKMSAFFRFISEMLASGKPATEESAIFTGSQDLLNDPEIREIRTEAQRKMTELLMGLIEEGKQQGVVNLDLTQEALNIYFAVFMDVFTSPGVQQAYRQNPNLIEELGMLMLHGLSGDRNGSL